ncbi:hypothetical protein OS493_015279 [Desmophyllum pertusum]|uniref:Uncharacterized protein n=1 Tax=Desmophyllum pertusum TaxID=174260 RepID=A0A9W9ZDW8_9CNID|nr:hypothetical protein OS493_015279 [Desmophyllum pertusum]
MMSEKLSEDKKTKRVQCSKKTNVRRKRKKAQPKSQTSRPNLQKGPQSCYNTSQVELSYVANSGKATRPQDISQEEFLSMFWTDESKTRWYISTVKLQAREIFFTLRLRLDCKQSNKKGCLCTSVLCQHRKETWK